MRPDDFRALLLVAAGILAGTAGTLMATTAPPTEHAGLSVALLGQVEPMSMEQQIGLKGQVLRLRTVDIEPGGQIAKHDHATRPGVVKVIRGSVVEGRPAGEKTFDAESPEIVVEDADTEHWFWNRGDAPATLLVCDIAPAE